MKKETKGKKTLLVVLYIIFFFLLIFAGILIKNDYKDWQAGELEELAVFKDLVFLGFASLIYTIIERVKKDY